MASKWMRKLGIGMSAIMTVSQLSGMVAMAAPEDDFGDRLEEQFEAEDYEIEDDVEAKEVILLDAEEEDIDSVEILAEELVPPTEVKWEGPGLLAFKPASSKAMFYGADIYRDGIECGWWTFGDCSPFTDEDGFYRNNVANYFEGSGTYTVKVYVKKDDSYESEKVYASDVPEIVWTQPEQRVVTPGNLHWENRDSEHFAVAVCDPVDHAYQYWFDLYDGDKWLSGPGSHSNEVDFSVNIGDVSEHNYYFIVRQVVSDDLTQYANSLKSEKSFALTLDGNIVNTQTNIVDLSKDVNASNIDEKVQQVKDLDNSTLKTSLQTNDEALASMAKIEDKYKETKGIDVLPSISDVDKIPADEIEMTGAALNVSEGTVQLNVKDQKEAGSSIINTDIYTNIIAFDMSVNSSEGVDFSKELEVPVTIAMPIPEGMDSSRLVILHYRADGAEELITPRIENGKAIFAITHFSTFALAEKKGSSEADVPDGPAPRIIVAEDGSSKVYQYGKEIENYTGLAMLGTTETAPWVYVENNKRNETFSGFVDYDGETFYVAGGTMATDLNGLQVDPSNGKDWYFLAGGQVQKHHEGLALYNGEWFYIKDGRLDTNLNAYVDYDGGKFFVGAGRIIQEYNGLAQDPQNTVNGDWYFLANGQAQTQYTGLAFYDNAWFYVIKGKLATDYTGTVDYDGATFNVVGGMVQESAAPATEPTTEPTTDPVITPEPKDNPLADLMNEDGYVVFGKYEQDGNTENGGEPIEWVLLGSNENGYTLISRYILDYQQYDRYEGTVYSSLEQWLNDEFINTAFTPEEQTRIHKGLFIMGINDLKNYYHFDFFSDEGELNQANGTGGYKGYCSGLITTPTVYAEQQGSRITILDRETYDSNYAEYYELDIIGKEGAEWWTSNHAAWGHRSIVNYAGAVGSYGPSAIQLGKSGVRPAIYITK